MIYLYTMLNIKSSYPNFQVIGQVCSSKRSLITRCPHSYHTSDSPYYNMTTLKLTIYPLTCYKTSCITKMTPTHKISSSSSHHISITSFKIYTSSATSHCHCDIISYPIWSTYIMSVSVRCAVKGKRDVQDGWCSYSG